MASLGSQVFWKELESRLPKTICSEVRAPTEWFPLMHTLEGRTWGSGPACHFGLKTESGPSVQPVSVLSLCARQCLNLRNCRGKYKGEKRNNFKTFQKQTERPWRFSRIFSRVGTESHQVLSKSEHGPTDNGLHSLMTRSGMVRAAKG